MPLLATHCGNYAVHMFGQTCNQEDILICKLEGLLEGNTTRETEHDIAEHWHNHGIFRVLPLSEVRMRSLTHEEGDIPLESYKGKTDDSALYEVDFIIDERRHGNTRNFRVKWKVRPLPFMHRLSPDSAAAGQHPVLIRWRCIVQGSEQQLGAATWLHEGNLGVMSAGAHAWELLWSS